MAAPELKLAETFKCVRCGAPCEVKRVGDLLVATCPAADVRYVLTELAPGDVAPERGEDPLIGQTLGPCRLVARAGFEGGLPVYQGLDSALSQSRAVRVLGGAAAKDKEQVQAFVRTGKLAATARHAGLANVSHLGHFEGGLYTVAPAIEGQTFEQAVLGVERLRLPEAIRIVRRLAEALAALHERRIVHRNVGPRSVFILPSGEPVLRNFTCAISADFPPEPKQVVGQPGFLAPEMIAGGAIDGRADLYSLGALLYFALVGHPPFGGATPGDVLRSQLAGPEAARQALTMWAPAELVNLLMRLLAVAPTERPSHARALIDTLAKLAAKPSGGGGTSPVLRMDEDSIGLADTPPPPPKPSEPAPKPQPRLRAAPADGRDMFTPPSDEPSEGDAQRPRTLPSLELDTRRAEKPAGPAPTLGPAAASPAPTPSAGPAAPAEDLVLETDRPGAAAAGTEAIVLPDEEPKKPLLTPRAITLIVVAAVGLGIFLLTRVVSCGSGPEPTAATPAKGGPAPVRVTGKKRGRTEPEKADTEPRRELARIKALANKGPKEAEEVVKQCDAFLERFRTGEEAEAIGKLREAALASQREKAADDDFRALQAGLRDIKRPLVQRLAEMDTFREKHKGTKAAAQVKTMSTQAIAAGEAVAKAAAATERKNIEKHLKAEAYGPAITLLANLAESFEGTKVGAAAATEAAELRRKLTVEFKEKKGAAEQLARRAAFSDALAQLDAPLNRWQFADLRREASDLAAALREQRGRIVLSYGAFLADFDSALAAWRPEEASAAATKAAEKADDPVLRELLGGKAGEAAAVLRARQLIIAGAKAEQAKAAKGTGKTWLQRSTGARLPAAIDNPSDSGLDAEMQGFKGHVAWGDLHVDQLLHFAHSAPGEATAADHSALALVALRAGQMASAFKEFDKAAELDPAALDGAAACLRRHAQGFVRIKAGQFPAGLKKEPKSLDAFLLARGEVTNAEFAFYARVTKAQVPPDWKVGLDDHPVANITGQQADAYARWLDMRLPTDLEWERAVRGTEGRLYPWGDKFDAGRANLARAGGKGTLAPSNLRQAYRHMSSRDDLPFFHLVGNVREWTSTLTLDPKGAVSGRQIVGGSAADPEAAALAHARLVRKPDARDPFTGFRLAWPR